jgi:hypothetical protein
VSKASKKEYLSRVFDALTTGTLELERDEYIDALEEIAADVDGMLQAAREDAKEEEETKR